MTTQDRSRLVTVTRPHDAGGEVAEQVEAAEQATAGRNPVVRIALRTVTTLAVLVLLAVLGVAWYFAGQLTASPPVRPFDPDNEVLDVDLGAATVLLGDEGFAAIDGAWGLQLPDDRHVVLTEQLERDGTGVRWGWTDLVGQPPPRVGEPVRVDEFVVVGSPGAVDLAFEDVVVEGPLGPLPSWWVPAADPVGTIVVVHGRGATREEALRFLPTLVDAGWNVLVQTYRGDEGAPAWPDGRVRYGTTEWRDVEAAMAYVADRRPDDAIVPFGVSMGGALVAQFLDRTDRGDLRASVPGVVLDSPILSLDALLDLQAGLNGIPEIAEPVLLPVVKLFADLRVDGFDSAALEQTADDGTFDVPTLVVHGSADGFVPVEPSARLAADDDDVRHVDVAEAGHVRTWNVDPEGYAELLTTFLDRLDA